MSSTGNATHGNILTAGIVSATGNVTGNYILGNGSQLAGLPATYGNANVAAYLPTYSGNLSPGNITTTGIISSTGNITGGNILGGANVNATTHTGTTVSVTGNITGGNILGGANVNATTHTGTTVSVTGNITGGNISTAGIVSVAGNVIANNFVGGGAGTSTISSTTNLDLSAAAAVRVIGGGTFRLPTLTTAQIANLTAANGDMVYNSSTTKIQAYAAGAWGNIALS
jgi:hypothetical protein